MGRGDGGLARIRHDVVEGMKEMGDRRYAYALERLLFYQASNDEFGEKLWRDVINEMKQGEAQ
jgi:hypothetical protein